MRSTQIVRGLSWLVVAAIVASTAPPSQAFSGPINRGGADFLGAAAHIEPAPIAFADGDARPSAAPGASQVVTPSLSSAGAALPDPATPLTTTAPALGQRPPTWAARPSSGNQVWVEPGAAGWLRSDDGRVALYLPPGAAQVRTALRYTPSSDQLLPEHILFAFTLDADDETGQPVAQFDQPLALSVSWELVPLASDALARLALFRWDTASGQWRVVPSTRDTAGPQLVASVHHLAQYALGVSTVDYITERMSALRGAQTNLFSLSVGYTYAFDLPPGSGGLTPRLALSYSSANHTPTSGHFSYVGFGWELLGADSVYIPPGDSNLNKKTLSLQGRTYTLHSGASGWYALEDPFLRISSGNVSHHTPGVWEVWTQDGIKYTFSAETEVGTYYWKLCDRPSDTGKRYVRIPLRSIQDVHGNTIDFTWVAETETEVPYDCQVSPSPLPTNQFKRAVRLSEITYNNGTVKVALSYAGRSDRPDGFDHAAWRFYTGQRLTSVAVRVRENGSGNWQTVRSYALGQSDGGTTHPSQKVLNLDWIEERAANGSPLPRTSFTYSRSYFVNQSAFGALTSARNGYGGEVVFVSNSRWGDENNAHVVSSRTERYGVTGIADQTWTYHGVDWDQSGGDEMAKGFKRVEITRPDGVAEWHYFLTIDTMANSQKSDHRAGREWKLAIRSGGQEVARTETDWEATTDRLPVAPLPGVQERIIPRFVRPVQTRTFEDSGAPLLRTDTQYDPDRQGGVQWGNVTQVEERMRSGNSWSALPVRTTYTWYYPSATRRITNKPARIELHSVCAGCPGGAILSQRLLYYDQNAAANYQQPPTKGLLRFDEMGLAPLRQVTEYQYWPNGNLRKAIDAQGRDTETFYDSAFRAYPVCTRNAWNWTTVQRYYGVPGSGDPEPGVWSACDNSPAGSGLAASGAFFGRVEQERDPNYSAALDTSVSYQYDAWGRLLRMIRPGDSPANPTQRYTFLNYGGPAAPFMVKTEQRDNASAAATATYLETRAFYDGFGRLMQTQSEAANPGQSIVANTRTNGLDQVVQQSLPYLVSGDLGSYRLPDWSQPDVQTAYDALGRVRQVINPDDTAMNTTYRHVLDNREVGVVDAMGRQEIRELDSLGRLVRVKQYLGAVTGAAPQWEAEVYASASYQYDAADRLTQVIGPDGAVTSLTYDALGRKTGLIDPNSGSWRYGYDLVGNLTSQTDARNTTLWFGYDALNRLVEKRLDYSGGALLAQYHYDEDGYGASRGRRTRAVAYVDGAAHNIVSTIYDSRGRLSANTLSIDGASYTVGYQYDSMDRVTWMQYPDGEAVRSTYSPQGQVQSVVGNSVYLADAAFNARGQAICYRTGDQANWQTQLHYRDGGDLRLGAITSGVSGGATCAAPSGTALQHLAYSYDLVGNVTSIVDSNNSSQRQCFTYDALDRLTRAFTTGDPTCTASNLTVGAGAYDEVYGYDDAQGGKGGNLTSKSSVGQYIYGAPAPDGCAAGTPASKPHAVSSAGRANYRYDCNGNMVARESYELTYDAENRLVRVSGPAQATFAYDADGRRVQATFDQEKPTIYVDAIYERSGAQVKKYYYAGQRRIAMRDNAALYYLFADHLSSSHIAYRTGVSSVSVQSYFPWGAVRPGPANILPTAYTFTGQRLDERVGLMYYGARYYDPRLGRFLSADAIVPDPGDPQGLNRYSYTLNNPIKYRDSSGHWAETVFDVAMLVWDIAEVKRDPSPANIGALILDVGAMALPFVPAGAGLVARGGKVATTVATHGDEALDAARAVSRASSSAQDGGRIVELLHGTSFASDAFRGGIDVARGSGQLGPGFYMAYERATATWFAKSWSLGNDSAKLVKLQIPEEAFSRLRVIELSANSLEFQRLTEAWQRGGDIPADLQYLITEYDAIIAPVFFDGVGTQIKFNPRAQWFLDQFNVLFETLP